MDEMDLQHAISDLVILQKEEFARNLKAMAIAAKAGFGSKEADREITKITRSAERGRLDSERMESLPGADVKVINTAGEKFDLKKLGAVKIDGGSQLKRSNNARTSRQADQGPSGGKRETR